MAGLVRRSLVSGFHAELFSNKVGICSICPLQPVPCRFRGVFGVTTANGGSDQARGNGGTTAAGSRCGGGCGTSRYLTTATGGPNSCTIASKYGTAF